MIYCVVGLLLVCAFIIGRFSIFGDCKKLIANNQDMLAEAHRGNKELISALRDVIAVGSKQDKAMSDLVSTKEEINRLQRKQIRLLAQERDNLRELLESEEDSADSEEDSSEPVLATGYGLNSELESIARSKSMKVAIEMHSKIENTLLLIKTDLVDKLDPYDVQLLLTSLALDKETLN